jgi:hypothetical protein
METDMTENMKTPKDPEEYGPSTLDGYMRMRVMHLFQEKNLPAVEKNAINQLAGTLALESGEDDKASARLEYLLCFLEGEIDWRKRYKEVFGLNPPTKMAPILKKSKKKTSDKKKKNPNGIEEPDF